MPEGTKKKVRTVGVNFPYDADGNFTYEALNLMKEREDRSLSRVAYRIIREYFENCDQSFEQDVLERLPGIAPPTDANEDDQD